MNKRAWEFYVIASVEGNSNLETTLGEGQTVGVRSAGLACRSGSCARRLSVVARQTLTIPLILITTMES